MTDTLKDEVKAFFDEFVKAYSNEDIEKYKSLFHKDESLIMFGAFGKWIGWDEYKDAPAKEIEEKFDTIAMKSNLLTIDGKDNYAWLAAEVEISITMPNSQFKFPARLTIIMNKINNEWKIVHGHTSLKAQ